METVKHLYAQLMSCLLEENMKIERETYALGLEIILFRNATNQKDFEERLNVLKGKSQELKRITNIICDIRKEV